MSNKLLLSCVLLMNFLNLNNSKNSKCGPKGLATLYKNPAWRLFYFSITKLIIMAFQLGIPQTILHQLGGANRLNAMLGVKRFLSCENETALSFKIANFSGVKINYIKIKLNGLDLYDIELGRIWGSKYNVIQSIENIYAEDLIETLERKTGLAFRL